MQLCLNMIVRNESERLLRCLNSVAPYISCAVILDTGSTDDTKKVIRKFFAERKIPIILASTIFKNFSQARNEALALARQIRATGSPKFAYDYIFLCDADMELKVSDPDWRRQLIAPTYLMPQTAGSITYNNTRLIHHSIRGDYHGATHEFIAVPLGPVVEGVVYHDHADGSNRKDKFLRDIRLLKEDLEKDPNNERSWFYLAQSYRDAGMTKEAAEAYSKRMNMGGYDEEAWNARVNYGMCLLDLKDEGGFIREMLAAYNQRPQRSEPLYDLSKFYRERGQPHAALLMAKAGVVIPRPNDSLFVNDFVYNEGFREEIAISAFFDPKQRDTGFAMCNQLALDPKVYPRTRETARANLYHYIKPLADYCPSFKSRPLEFNPHDEFTFEPTGYTVLNPSVTTHGAQIFTTVRTVNYTMDNEGRYLIKGTNGEANQTNPIHTRNYLARLSSELSIEIVSEIQPPVDMPPPKFDLVIGFEDMRLFSYQGSLWTSSTVRELNSEGYCEQVLARVGEIGRGYQLDSARVMRPAVRLHEKNWMPVVGKEQALKFIYRLDTVVDSFGQELYKHPCPVATDAISGGSQLVPFGLGWIALVHEARALPGSHKRYYQHRFVTYNQDLAVKSVSPPFVFHDRQIEFAAGLARHPIDELYILSYGVRDEEARIATVGLSDLMDFVR